MCRFSPFQEYVRLFPYQSVVSKCSFVPYQGVLAVKTASVADTALNHHSLHIKGILYQVISCFWSTYFLACHDVSQKWVCFRVMSLILLSITWCHLYWWVWRDATCIGEYDVMSLVLVSMTLCHSSWLVWRYVTRIGEYDVMLLILVSMTLCHSYWWILCYTTWFIVNMMVY